MSITEHSGLSRRQLAAMIDHTFLKAFGEPADIDNLCHEALTHRFATVMVNPAEIERCRTLIGTDELRIGTVIGFPLGQSASVVKAYEVQDALTRGALDIDLVQNVRALQANDYNIVRRELASLSQACREAGAVSKVILETCYLNDEQKHTACQIALDCGVDFVKTSSGFGTAGAEVADVRLMRAAVGDKIGVKAAGGIRDLGTALAMIDAGADRLGCSNSVALIDALPAT